MPALHIVNPENRETGRYAGTHRYVLWFGACGSTYLMIWERSLEAALETAGGWLADNAPGLIMSPDDRELDVLYREACEELGEDPDNGDGPGDAWEQATADLTYTESGYIPSDEWGIVFDEHSRRADVKAWIADLAERHYSDEPLVSVG